MTNKQTQEEKQKKLAQEALKKQIETWRSLGYPIELLEQDPKAARFFTDNGMLRKKNIKKI